MATHQPAIASLSLGRAYAGHTLATKLSAASAAGFKGIEAFYEDLETIASSLPGGCKTDASIIAAAHEFRTLADTHGLQVIVLQPFMHYEGLLDETEQRKRMDKLHLWFQLARILGTDVIIQVPSNFLPEEYVTGDWEVIVRDLRVLADEGLRQSPPVRFAYEGICWGTFVDTWKQTWEIVRAVERENFGLCLDVFHLVGREWADPAAESGTVGEEADRLFAESMREMAKKVDVEKVYYVQVADAERPEQPIRPGHPLWVDGQPARMTWSRNMRTFAMEEKGYTPVTVALKAILEPPPTGLGYTGWVSMEVFSQSLEVKDSDVPYQHAERAKKSWKAMKRAFGFNQT